MMGRQRVGFKNLSGIGEFVGFGFSMTAQARQSRDDVQVEADVEDLFGHVLSGTEQKARGPGRRAGSLNKKTLDTARQITKITDPLENLAVVASLPIDEIARRLGMKMADAAEFWRKCNNDLAPYTHSKMPTAVNVGRLPSAPINMGGGLAPVIENGSGRFNINPIKSIAYENETDEVTATKSPPPPKPLKDNDV
jgi:hypothetical protein